MRSAFIAVLLAATALAGPALAKEPVKVVASFSIIGDLARNVGGERIALTTLVGPDGDAHVFEPRPADAAAMGAADVILVNGLGLEGFMKRLAEASGTKAPVVVLSEGASALAVADEPHPHEEDGEAHDHAAAADHDHDHEHAAGDGHDHGPIDPHAWQSVANARIYVANIAKALCGVDAEGCATFEANAQAYDQKLAKLDADIRAEIAGIPQDRRTIITSHDAFGYFERDYGIAFLAPEGVSTEAEASAADVAALIRQVRDDKASAVFVENITNTKLIEQIASETGLKVGGALFSDALSPPDGPAATYLDMMRHNVSTIKGAVLGS